MNDLKFILPVRRLLLPLICAASLGVFAPQAVLAAPPPLATQSPAAQSLRLVVMPFRNLSQNREDAWLSESLSESLTQALTGVENLQLIERNQIQVVLQEQYFTQSAFADPQSAPELGKLLGAQQILLGNFQKQGQTLLISTRVVDVKTGQILPEFATQIKGSSADIFALQEELSRSVLKTLRQSPRLQMARMTESSPALQHYREARDRARSETPTDLQSALKQVNQALEQDPDFARAYGLRAELEARLALIEPGTRQQRLESALQDANRALQKGAPLDQVYLALAQVYFARGERQKGLETLREIWLRDAKNTDAILSYLQASDETPELQIQALRQAGADLEDPWVALALGNRYLKQAQYALEPDTSSALFWLKKAQSQLPDVALIPLRMGEVYTLAQDFERAEQALQAALRLEPENFLLYFLAARVIFASPNPQLAQTWYEKSIALNPQFGFSQMNLGYVFWRQGQTERALALFKQAEALFPESAAFSFVRAKTLFMQRRFEEARVYLLQALERYEKDPTENISRGAIYFKLGEIESNANDFEAAIRYYMLATQEERQFQSWSYLKLSRIFALRKEYPEALDYFRKHLRSSGFRPEDDQKRDQASLYLLEQVQLNPDNVLLLNELGRYSLQDGDFTLADRYFNQALSSGTENLSIRYNLALSQFYQRRWQQATQNFLAVLAQEPQHEKARYMLGLSQLRAGQTEAAIQTWQELLKMNPQHTEAKLALEGIKQPEAGNLP
ncbi:hypothetical protein COW36_16995 [bacterium (Candidatus Blackallbacteria) CG17_big_fil_post_rev_8_21_14_2_50_48_46]|uniref:UDP-N-acetylglucosamine--peptide N-acetylglucosaminyltransferase SPINDLY n=1 Tax=bacterium (Candidatus Blackallbacteria) CG17_big_fil_post_rev_8_21_14_2_50_48_46 TaxID=2014261 RepID=A0A2M7G1A6_9BACT|nr:MAG: hypothetical protein COW64_09305 [bacterium (Candidatus Blackallbacteria) CG18_big_fil_WC_8_21_14_2_50_49_26]PIW15499.1 MAG: hypothetical protein COW36_16995 [bacterium (Candidatus Blackallbacteria) CG17_big_fil_post_rev_8_21_14_2_50_48_46]PIW48601.1 MAG: hypothetical protein COW20_08850 [bacterium (Candidatus Blackallbacteria) CG13_big_fil_rev_8_21_14_2_50_49_14]